MSYEGIENTAFYTMVIAPIVTIAVLFPFIGGISIIVAGGMAIIAPGAVFACEFDGTTYFEQLRQYVGKVYQWW
jgi:hypothetical protein